MKVTLEHVRKCAADPLALQRLLWPKVRFYKEQLQVIESVWRDRETYVPAGNMLGKDYVAGFIALAYFLSNVLLGKTCRVITTSVKDDHLRVLWGEIGRFVQDCRFNIDVKKPGGLLVLNHRDYRVAADAPGYYSYLRGMVSEKGEGMTGHHAERTLLVIDEGSGVDEQVYDQGRTWAGKVGGHTLVIGNPNPCTNFFFRGVEAGDDKAEDNGHYFRRVIRIRAEDSPNVRYGRLMRNLGKTDDSAMILPGVLTLADYDERRAKWDIVRQTIGLDAQFYKGAEVLMFPPDWLNNAEQVARALGLNRPRVGCSLGVDSAMGGDNTSWVVTDKLGLRHVRSKKTRDTAVIVPETIAIMREWNIPPEMALFDVGGGGKQHADVLRAKGYNGVRIVNFGESPTPELKHTGVVTTLPNRKLQQEDRRTYVNRRAEMYGILSNRIDPGQAEMTGRPVFAMPYEIVNQQRMDGGPGIRGQLAPIQKLYDEGGRIRLPLKNRKPGSTAKEMSLMEMIGCSPDEADALVLSVFGQEVKSVKSVARSMI